MVTRTQVSIPDGTNATTTSLQGLTIILLILSLIANVISVLLLSGFSLPFSFGPEREDNTIGIKRALLDLEYEKVGGKKNYDTLQKYSQMQIASQISQIESYVNNPDKTPATTQPQQPTAQPTEAISQDEVKTILADASLEGNKDAPIAVIEYSDMECPFCMKQYHDTQLFPKLTAQYKDQVVLAFKNNRGVNHKGTEAKALGALCAAKIGGDSAYQKFYKGVMDGSTNAGGVLDVAKLGDVAKASGLDQKQWQTCVDGKETLARFVAQTQEAQKFGLGGTPGTLVLNVKTGKYKTIEGAYPYETFTAAIDELMKN